MTTKVPSSSKALQLRRLVAEEHRLIQEKATLESMLKNLASLRNKLKVEQIQLSSQVKAELGESMDPLARTPSPEQMNIVEEEANIAVTKPTLDLRLNPFHRMILGGGGEEDEEEDSEEDIGCAQEVFAYPTENDLDFDDF